MNTTSRLTSETVICGLIANLESQLEIHEVLLEALSCEGRLPASCTLTELNDVQSVRNLAVFRIRELEKNRLDLVQTYKQVNEIKKPLTLREIIQQSDPVYQEKLLSLREKLVRVISEIRPVGRKNAEIALARITCFDEIQKVIDKSFQRLSTYSGKGYITKAKGSSRMNRAI